MTETTTELFSQRLDASFFDAVQSNVIDRMREAGLDAVFTVDPEDVAYLTGFFHHPCERPVAVWLEATGRCLLLVPVLERDHAESQNARAEILDYAEFPGLESPYAVLARAVDPAVRRVGHSTTISYERLAAAADALDRVTLSPTGLIMEARYIKHPGEIALHQEAARITDAMIVAGVELITDAIADGQCVASTETGEMLLNMPESKAMTLTETLSAVFFIMEAIKANGYELSTMGEAAKNFIANWESEKYRKSLAGKKG